MYEFTLSDNTKIEVTVSDCHSGPSVKFGQRVGMAIWYRVNGGEWTKTVHRNMQKFLEWVRLSENLADFLEGEKEEKF